MPARLWLSAHKTLVYIIRVSQGNVATQLRCGGILNNNFIANFPLSVSERIMRKMLKIDNVIELA